MGERSASGHLLLVGAAEVAAGPGVLGRRGEKHNAGRGGPALPCPASTECVCVCMSMLTPQLSAVGHAGIGRQRGRNPRIPE